ncbi:MAG: RodZ domain-containing protein [Pseudomonadota bacterium]
MELRGFDSYEISLGDELRGERACRGWSLRDAARELCIKPAFIEAIENGDATAFPNRSVVPGYVRSYARHLDLDADDIYRRFCDESGFESSLATYGMSGAAAEGDTLAGRMSGAVAADFTASRFAVKPAPRRIGAAISLGGIVSVAALSALIAGLGYGGYAVLQDIQRVGVAPLPEAPAVVADAPTIPEPGLAPFTQPTTSAARPDASAYERDGVMLAFAPPEALATPAPARRDGPISAIDPNTAGLIAANYEPAREIAAGESAEQAVAARARLASLRAGDAAPEAAMLRARVALTTGATADLEGAEQAEVTPAAPFDAATARIAILATDRAWIRVRMEGGAVLYEGILKAGERYDLPEGASGAVLKAGNAGGIVLALDERRYGPIGTSGQVVRRIVLDGSVIAASYDAAQSPDAEGNGGPGGEITSIEARLD